MSHRTRSARQSIVQFLGFVPVMVMALTVPSRGQPADRPTGASDPGAAARDAPETDSAAKEYQRIWDSKPSLFDNKFLLNMNAGDPNWKPQSEVAAQLEAAQPEIKGLILASRLEKCEWPIARENGWETKLPHLSKMSASTRVLFGDARRLEGAGDIEGAAERLAAIIRMSRHLRSDRMVTSSRTGQSNAAVALGEIASLAKAGKLTPKAKQVLSEAVRTLDGADPLEMKDAFGAEGPLIRDWVKATFKGSDAGKAFLQRLNPPPKEDVRAASGLENMDEKALATSADSLAVMYKEIVANWGAADAVMIMRSIETQKKNGDYGGLGVLIGSEIQHSRVVVARFAGGVIAEAKTALESAK